jgi:hypothetical protein
MAFEQAKNKRNERVEHFKYVGSLVVITLCAYFGFGTAFRIEHDAAAVVTEFSAGAFGAIFSAVLVMFLLKQQTEHQGRLVAEQSKHAKDQEIFKEQVALFKIIIDKVEQIFKDDRIGRAELKELGFMLTRLRMMAGDVAIKDFRNFYEPIASRDDEIPTNEISIEIDIEDRNRFQNFVDQCRVELNLADKKIPDAMVKDIKAEAQKVEKNKEPAYKILWEKKAPGSVDRIGQLLKAVNEGTVTGTAALRYTQQYIAILVGPEANRVRCAWFEPSLTGMFVNIPAKEDPELKAELNKSFTDVWYKERAYRVKILFDEKIEKWQVLEKLIKDSARKLGSAA